MLSRGKQLSKLIWKPNEVSKPTTKKNRDNNHFSISSKENRSLMLEKYLGLPFWQKKYWLATLSDPFLPFSVTTNKFRPILYYFQNPSLLLLTKTKVVSQNRLLTSFLALQCLITWLRLTNCQIQDFFVQYSSATIQEHLQKISWL